MTDQQSDDTNPPAEAPVEDPTTASSEPSSESDAHEETTQVDEPEVVNTVTPPADPNVTPAASETPDVQEGDISALTPGILIPTNGSFGSAEEVRAAQEAGLPNPTGTPLDTYSQEILRGIETSLAGIESWIAHIRRQVAKVPNP